MKLKPDSKNKKSKIKFSKVAVVLVLIQVFVYTWVHLILSAFAGIEIAPTTSCAFYGFCGAEAGLLAWIRKIDKQNDQKDQESEEYERTDFSETDES